MATFDYEDARATALELIAEFGQEVTLHKRGASSGPGYDPAPGATTDHLLTAVDLELAAKDRNGALVGETRRTLYVAGGPIEPTKGDAFTVGGTSHEVVEVRTLAPGATVVLWEVDLAR